MKTITSNNLEMGIIESLVLDGDLSRLTPQQRVQYYVHRCAQIGVDPGEQPFQVLKLSGKMMLYATKSCTNALSRINNLSIEIRKTTYEGTVVIVEARASSPKGQFADDVGVVDTKEERLSRSNAIMKAVTKAKRRAVLSLVGLGILDESEVDSIANAERVELDTVTGAIDVEQVEAKPVRAAIAEGARCSGPKGSPIARALGERCAALAEHYGVAEPDAYHRVLERAQIDPSSYGGNYPAPGGLLIEDGLAASAWVKAKLDEIEAEADAVVAEAVPS